MKHAKQGVSQSDFVCACFEITRSDLQSMVAEDPNMTFDRMMEESNAGRRCTACLLDLEYEFTQAKNMPRKAKTGTSFKRPKPEIDLKQKLYRQADRLFPAVGDQLFGLLPVLSGPGMTQYIRLTNDSLLYEGEVCAPVIDYDLVVTAADGRVCHQERIVVEPDSSARVSVSDKLLEPEAGEREQAPRPLVGAVWLRWQYRKPGFKGTSRPQTEIVTGSSNCSLHAQGGRSSRDTYFSMVANPVDRLFVSIINTGWNVLDLDMYYPMNSGQRTPDSPRHRIQVPSRGTHLHEVTLTPEEVQSFQKQPIQLQWSGDRRRTCHIICSNRDLTRLSMDHI